MKNLQIHELGTLFEEVQLKNILSDGKTFPDCIPKKILEEIQDYFLREKNSPGFDLAAFVEKNFTRPAASATNYVSNAANTARQHIESLWDVLTRQPDREGGSLLPLPHPYAVPGGRFREIYYWDSYFTMLGLQVSRRLDLIKNMVDNFSYLIHQVGYIPNGNRTYFLGRSQPPFFSLMIKLLQEEMQKIHGNSGPDILANYLPALEKEYEFWMQGAEIITPVNPARHRVVLMPDGTLLNRYWDDHTTPRPEAYKEDVELAHQSSQKPEELYRHLRAAAESGWDFSSRWFSDHSFGSIHTTDIIPVDLNCLLVHLEEMLAGAWKQAGNTSKSSMLQSRAEQRRIAITKYCWSDQNEFFFDFDFIRRKQKPHFTLAAAFPLFFGIASLPQASCVKEILRNKLLKPGGLTTTLTHTGQQWDAPNGWAPLQWIAFRGLSRYGFEEDAIQVKTRWVNINEKVYVKTGKMTEKYDVWNEQDEASGGEYPNQDGFGWTNGVYLAMTT